MAPWAATCSASICPGPGGARISSGWPIRLDDTADFAAREMVTRRASSGVVYRAPDGGAINEAIVRHRGFPAGRVRFERIRA